jgi:hypothetical protein
MKFVQLKEAFNDNMLDMRVAMRSKVKVNKEFTSTHAKNAHIQLSDWLKDVLSMTDHEFKKQKALSYFKRKGCIIDGNSDNAVTFDGTKL